MKYFIPFLIFLAGCSTEISVKTTKTETPADATKPEQTEEKKSSHWDVLNTSKDWVVSQFSSKPLTDEEKKTAEEKRVQAEQEKVNNIKSSDELVATWTNRLGETKTLNSGFVHHEGLTETDAFGNFIKVQYEQDGFYEKLVVTSAGPDGKFGTADDLSRNRFSQKPFAFYNGLGFVGWTIVAWIVSIPLFLLIFSMDTKNSQKRRTHPVLKAVFAPIYLVIVLIGVCVTGVADGFDGIDLDFD